MIQKDKYNVIIAGTRTFNDYHMLCCKCDEILEPIAGKEITVFSGCSSGADMLGEQYAKARGFSVKKFPAQWNLHGRAAGPIRNSLMAAEADVLICFWDGMSKGTEDMIKKASNKGMEIHKIVTEKVQ